MVNMQKIALWLGVLIVSMLVMIRPVHAVDVPAILKWVPPFPSGADQRFSTVAEVCSYHVSKIGAVCLPASCSVINETSGLYHLTHACGQYDYIANQVYVCPSGYTGPDANGMCSTTCPARLTTFAVGLFDVGTDPNRLSPGITSGCAPNNCGTTHGSLNGISKRGLVGGVMHYYAVGDIVYTGETCQSGAPSVATTVDPNIQQTCGSGQTAVTGANGFFKCYNDSATPAVSAVPTTTTQTTTGTTTTTDPTTGASSVTTSTTVSETVTTGGGGAAATTPAPADPLTDYCAQNPTAEVCKQGQPSGTVTTPPVDGLYNGDLNAAGHATVSDVVGGFKNRVLSSPVGGAIGGFFNVTVASGTCPVWSADVPMFGVLTMDAYCVPWFQNLLPLIKSIIMIVFSVAAFRIAIL